MHPEKMGLASDMMGILKSGLLAISAGGVSQILGMLTAPIMITAYQISANFGWAGAILLAVILVRLIIQDTKEYLEMGIFSIIAILMQFLPIGTAVILMVLSWVPLYILGVKVGL